jgi:hypothetical protein
LIFVYIFGDTMESEFPSNRKKDRVKSEPKAEKKVEKVTQSEVVRRKKPIGKKVSETFIGGDARSVWAFVAIDVLIPAAKDMIADAVSQGVERMIYGDARSTSRRSGRRPADGPYVSYNRISKAQNRGVGPDPRGHHQLSRRARASHDFDEIILATRVEAEEVLERLYDLVSKYETATVADLYDLVGITGSYTDDKWGWFELRGAGVTRIRNGYLLDLPKPEPLD